MNQDFFNDPDEHIESSYSGITLLISQLQMSTLTAVLIISAVVGLSPSVNAQPYQTQDLSTEQIQASYCGHSGISVNCSEIKVAHQNNQDIDPSDKAPKPGDGRREN